MIGQTLKRAATSKYLSFIFRLCVGGFFLYACMSKIPYPAQFAEATANYQIVPYWMINPGAIFLPWAEFVCALFLIIGFMSRASAIFIGLMLIMFNTMVLINMYWGAPISCGCYDTVGEPIGWKKIIENAILLGLTIHVFFFDRLLIFRKGSRTDPSKISVLSPGTSR
jgi:putative oxidoreductase